MSVLGEFRRVLRAHAEAVARVASESGDARLSALASALRAADAEAAPLDYGGRSLDRVAEEVTVLCQGPLDPRLRDSAEHLLALCRSITGGRVGPDPSGGA